MFSAAETRRLTAWIAADVDPAITAVEVERMAGGHSSGAWRVDASGDGTRLALVLKAPEEPSVVYGRDAVREARILDALGRGGAPVPPVVAIDDGARTIGRRCFLMQHVDGRSVNDVPPGGYHDDASLREAGPDAQRAIWESFHDALAALHSVDSAKVADASLGSNGITDVIEYWHTSLLDATSSATVPRQLALLDWLREHLPSGADDTPAVCMGDARLVNGLIVGTEIRALVDFEVAYAGHPAADIGYSLFFDGLQRRSAEQPLPGIPSADETWTRWSRATGRDTNDRGYWTAFGAMVLCITATRAMLQWGLAESSVETDNPLVTAWEQTVQRAHHVEHDMTSPIIDVDEQFHPVDPDDWSWNESWFFSWIDLDGGPAGFFRVGVLPNQRRAMLWSFVHTEGAQTEGRWFGVEESRLAFDDLDLADGVGYDRWALQFAWQPSSPLTAARFTFTGDLLQRSGEDAGGYVAVSVDLAFSSTSDAIGTGTGDDDRESPYAANRFEQPGAATGTVVVGGRQHAVRAGAHRDKSWGPREWRQAFTLGDLQAGDRQLYFVGRSFPGLGGGFLRDGDALHHVATVDGSVVEYDDEHRTITAGHLRFAGRDARDAALDVELAPIAPSVAFDMAHTCEVPEHWLYWRTLVEARVSGWDGTCRGWFETSRYGIA